MTKAQKKLALSLEYGILTAALVQCETNRSKENEEKKAEVMTRLAEVFEEYQQVKFSPEREYPNETEK